MKCKVIQILCIGIGIVGFLWFFIPVCVGKLINIGNITGIVVSLFIFIYGLKMKTINKYITRLWKYKIGKMCLGIMGLCIAAVFLLTFILSMHMIVAVHNKPSEGETVVVLGCRVYGEKASLMLEERIIAVKNYLQENPNAVCILSGGKGAGESISEAECMYRYLVDCGIDPSRLFKEECSTSTRENLSFSKEIIVQQNLNRKIAIVTNEFHEYRACKIAENLGLEPTAIAAKTAIWLFPTYYVRELYGILYEWVF